ncbi:UNVERIFIED_CONTAM: hypothetical protein GTU68_063576 [Idotea baltica]|nr:hypothetical protein [Idotea baltica]
MKEIESNIVNIPPKITPEKEAQKPYITDSQKRLNDKLNRALGDKILEKLKDTTTEDIFRNEDGKVWLKKSGQKEYELLQTMSDGMAEAILRTVASSLEYDITPERPFLDGVLPTDGSRIHGNIPPASIAPTFTIRRKSSILIGLQDYVDQGTMTVEQKDILEEAIITHENIFVVGSTGSGKTTLVNGLMDAAYRLTPNDRFVILEDTPEVQCNAINKTFLKTTEERELSDLVKESLRMRPDRIIVGEVRGAEALNLLEIWNTGHRGGIATAHAETATAEGAMKRLEMLIASSGIKFDATFVRNLIASTVNIIVCIDQTTDGRKITSVSEVREYDEKRAKHNFYRLDTGE